MNSWSNEDLARLLRPQRTSNKNNVDLAPRPGLSTGSAPTKAVLAGQPAPPKSEPASFSLLEVCLAAQPLSEGQIPTLFLALRRGTEARLHRETTASEVKQLVEAVNQARQLLALAAGALAVPTMSTGMVWTGRSSRARRLKPPLTTWRRRTAPPKQPNRPGV